MKLSIIVTSFNIENYIEKCILSILNQTLSDIEIIIVDDASTDNTQSIIKQYAEKDNRIKTIFFEKNTIGGVASAANAGMEIATGDYIGFADGDDWYEPTMFEELYVKAKNNDCEIAFCNYLEFDESNAVNKEPSDAKKWSGILKYNHDIVEDEAFKKLFLRFNPVPWRKIYKTSFLKENSIIFPVGDYFFEDNPFHWETTVKAKRFAFTESIGCYHRINRPGQTMGTADKRLLAMYEHHHTIITMLKKSNTFEEYKIQCLGWLVGNTAWISKKINQDCLEALFYTFKKQIALYPEELIENVLGTPVVGMRGTDLIKSVLEDNFSSFIFVAQGINSVDNAENDVSKESFFRYLLRQTVSTYKAEGLKSTVVKIIKFINYKFNLKLRRPNIYSNERLFKEIAQLNAKVDSLNDQMRFIKASLIMMDEKDKK